MDNNEQESISKKLLIFDGLIVGLIVLVIFAIYMEVIRPSKDQTANAIQTTIKNNSFESISIIAKSVYVFDVAQNKVIFEKDSNTQLPLASLTKLMMALTASDLLPKDSKITIKKEFLGEEGDSGLLVNESWELKDLLDFSLVVSSNDGARSIASVIGAFNLKTNDYDLGRKEFISMMNRKSSEIGLSQTYFINESGLDIDSFSGGYGTANDVSKLIQHMISNKPDLLEATKYQSISIDSLDKTHIANNTNKEINEIPGLIASKTGYTNQAGGNLVVAFDASIGRPIIVVVMGSTQEGRFSDIKTLVDASLEYIRQ